MAKTAYSKVTTFTHTVQSHTHTHNTHTEAGITHTSLIMNHKTPDKNGALELHDVFNRVVRRIDLQTQREHHTDVRPVHTELTSLDINNNKNNNDNTITTTTATEEVCPRYSLMLVQGGMAQCSQEMAPRFRM